MKTNNISCQWFARCVHPATGVTPHAVLGAVLTCNECHKRATGKVRTDAPYEVRPVWYDISSCEARSCASEKEGRKLYGRPSDTREVYQRDADGALMHQEGFEVQS